MNFMFCILVAVWVSSAHAQTLVHFSPAEDGAHGGLPVAAGFAYAFQAPAESEQNTNVFDVEKKNKAKKSIFPQKKSTKKGKSISVPSVLKTQYHSQDELGQYAYGYIHNDASHHEERTADGGVTGTFSYYDAAGTKQSAQYRADKFGYRVEATNLPNLESIKPTPEVEAATRAHLEAVQEIKLRNSLVPHAYEVLPTGSETPEVAAARAAHLKVYNEIRNRHALRRSRRSAHRYNQGHSTHGGFRSRHGGIQTPHTGFHSLPRPVTPTPAVQYATNAHLQAKHAAHKYGPGLHVGIPDTPAVAAARQQHHKDYQQIAHQHASRWRRSARWNDQTGHYTPEQHYAGQPADDGRYRPEHHNIQFRHDDGLYRGDHHQARGQVYATQQRSSKSIRNGGQSFQRPQFTQKGLAPRHRQPASRHHQPAVRRPQPAAPRHQPAARHQQPRQQSFRVSPTVHQFHAPSFDVVDHRQIVGFRSVEIEERDTPDFDLDDLPLHLLGAVQGFSEAPRQSFNSFSAAPRREFHAAPAQTFAAGPGHHEGIADTPAVTAARNAHFRAFNAIARDHASRW